MLETRGGGTPGSPLSSAGMSRHVCTVWQAEGSRSGAHCSFLYRCESCTQDHICESVTRHVPPLHCLLFIDRLLTAERTQADQLRLNNSIKLLCKSFTTILHYAYIHIGNSKIKCGVSALFSVKK